MVPGIGAARSAVPALLAVAASSGRHSDRSRTQGLEIVAGAPLGTWTAESGEIAGAVTVEAFHAPLDRLDSILEHQHFTLIPRKAVRKLCCWIGVVGHQALDRIRLCIGCGIIGWIERQ